MGLPTVKESCCGCALDTGTKIIGYVHLILSCILFLFFGTVLSAILTEGSEGEMTTEAPTTTQATKEENIKFLGKITSKQFFSLVVSAFIAVAPAIVGITSIILLIGAKKKMPYLLLPWLIGMSLLILLYAVLIVLFVYILFTDGSLDKHFVSVAIKIGISCYCYIVVYSFFIELKELQQDKKKDQPYVC